MLLLDNEGKERVRLEGWPNEYFLTALGSGLGRIAFVHENYRMRSAGTTTRSRASTGYPIGVWTRSRGCRLNRRKKSPDVIYCRS